MNVRETLGRNTGVKTVPAYKVLPVQPLPMPAPYTLVVRQSQPERKGLPSWVILVGVLAGLYVISRRR